MTGLQAGVTREFSAYPELDEVPRMLEDNYDVIIVDLDSNPEYALDLVETICSTGSPTVMVYSAHTDSELLVRCMRAGARESAVAPFRLWRCVHKNGRGVSERDNGVIA